MAHRCSLPTHATNRGRVCPHVSRVRPSPESNDNYRYYKLAQSRDNPNAQPSWALDPSADLHLWTTAQPPILKPYETAIAQNLQMLMADCGFNAAVFPLRHSYDINIRFPERIANRPRSVIPQLLQIDDQFSCANGARRFSQRLLGNDQAVSGGEGGDNASRSSSVTLSESSQAGPRRSTRKRNRRGKRTAASRSVSQASTAPGTLAEGSTRRSARIRYASTPTL
jgi:hypothetical protein